MSARLLIVVMAGIVAGCSHSDPIDRLIARLQEEAKGVSFTSYPFRPVDLPTNASPQEVIIALSNRGDFGATNVGVIAVREVQTPEDVKFRQHHTAVLVDTSAGQKIVLTRPMARGWDFKIYDAK